MSPGAMAPAVVRGVGSGSSFIGTACVVVLTGIAAALSIGLGWQRLSILLVLAPWVEETVFRTGLQEGLLRRWRSPLAANIVTALAFGLAHAAVRGSAAAFGVVLPAVLVGAVYGRRRQLLPCVLLHAVMNAWWLVFARSGLAASLGL